IPAFIITLGGLLVFKGLHWLGIESETGPVAPGGTTNAYSVLTPYYLPPLVGYGLCAVIAAALGLGMWHGVRKAAARGLPVDGEATFLRWFLASQVLFLFVLVMNQYK